MDLPFCKISGDEFALEHFLGKGFSVSECMAEQAFRT